jgi:hypothetical protein
MWISTGMGESKNLWLAAVTAAPPVISANRTAPKNTGMRLMKIREAGTSHRPLDRPFEVETLTVSVAMT